VTIPALHRSVTVNASVEKAFKVYTEGFSTWWPPQHHIGAADLAEAILEPHEGGRWFERGTDGSECDWGRVLAYEPPARLLLAWHLNGAWSYDPDPGHASEIEVTFTELGDGRTRVDVEHRAFERHGATAAQVQAGVSGDEGWLMILNRYAQTVETA